MSLAYGEFVYNDNFVYDFKYLGSCRLLLIIIKQMHLLDIISFLKD